MAEHDEYLLSARTLAAGPLGNQALRTEKYRAFDDRARLTTGKAPQTLHEQKERAEGRADREGEDYVNAPADYEALFNQYYSYTCGLVRKLGIDSQRTEDVASEILLRFMERDFLTKYDPDYSIVHDGKARAARFKSFLSAFVAVYVQHHRDRQNVQARRELIKCDQPVGDGTAAWIDVFGPQQTDDYSMIEEEELVESIRQYLASIPPRSKQDVCDLSKLFEVVVVQIRLTGRIDVKELQGIFGVSNTAIHSWIGLLRRHVRRVVEANAVTGDDG